MSRDGLYPITLRFDKERCLACHAERLRGLPCPECGTKAQEHEISAIHLQRQRLSVEIVSKLDSDGASRAAYSATDVLQLIPMTEVSEWLESFMGALAKFSEHPAAYQQAVLEETKLIHSIASSVRLTPERRVYENQLDLLREITQTAIRLAKDYVRALGSDTPLEAKKHAARGQQGIDQLSAALQEYRILEDRLDGFSAASNADEMIHILLHETMRVYDSRTILEIPDRVSREFACLFGSNKAISSMKYDFAMFMAQHASNPARQRAKKRLVRYFENFARPGLLTLINEEDFSADLGRTTLELYDALHIFFFYSKQANSRQALRTLVGIHNSVLETAGSIVASALLRTTGVKTRLYSRLRQEDASELIRSVRKEFGSSDFLENFDIDLRNAGSHGRITYRDEGIVLDARTAKGELDAGDILDRVLGSIEEAAAGLLALRIAVAASGGVNGSFHDFNTLGMTTPGVVRILVHGLTGIDPQIAVEASTIIVSFPHRPDSLLSAVSSSIYQFISHEYTLIRFCYEDVVIEGPLAKLPKADENALDLVLAMRQWTRDGVPVATSKDVTAQVALTAFRGISPDLGATLSLFRQLRGICAGLHLSDLDQKLREITREIRLHPGIDTDSVKRLAGPRLIAFTQGYRFPIV